MRQAAEVPQGDALLWLVLAVVWVAHPARPALEAWRGKAAASAAATVLASLPGDTGGPSVPAKEGAERVRTSEAMRHAGKTCMVHGAGRVRAARRHLDICLLFWECKQGDMGDSQARECASERFLAVSGPAKMFKVV